MSDNKRAWWDNSQAGHLQYKPSGRSEDFAPEILNARTTAAPDAVGDFFQGGPFCSDEFAGDVSRVKKA
jgi:uronate dehydrogenase